MKGKQAIYFIAIILFVFLSIAITNKGKIEKEKEMTYEIKASVSSYQDGYVKVNDEQNNLYTFKSEFPLEEGDEVLLTIKKEINDTEGEVVSYEVVNEETSNKLFANYYDLARKKLETLSLEEKIGQLFLVPYDKDSSLELNLYHIGGFIFYEKDFNNKTTDEVKEMINSAQKNSKIPLITAVDEEGGAVTRISKNKNLVKEPFKSSQALYAEGGFDKIKEDTISKSKLLYSLGLNLNLAPVVDVSTDSEDYIYARSFGKDTALTSEYASTVISASIKTGVSYTLKHFPGYARNTDTHKSASVDNRSKDVIMKTDIPPFESGIKANAEAVLVSHNVFSAFDEDNPASLSKKVHELLTDNLSFSGVIITDDLAMDALDKIENKGVKAILAGNDLIITSEYKEEITKIKEAIENKTLSESDIDEHALQIIAWKYYKGLIKDLEK